MTFNIVLRNDEYWLEGHSEGPIGPYKTKAEANEGKTGLDRFYAKHIHEKPTYVPAPILRPEPPPPAPTKRKRKPKSG